MTITWTRIENAPPEAFDWEDVLCRVACNGLNPYYAQGIYLRGEWLEWRGDDKGWRPLESSKRVTHICLINDPQPDGLRGDAAEVR